ncbi:MAG: glycosyltransferase, partial [Actinomycetota bacterium]|nr:glycosyltransferase [Actinomycetota bacterium]
MADHPMGVRPRVLVIASWYPSADAPTAGIFIQQQVLALATVADVAVLHVEWGRSSFAPQLSREDGATVVRAGVRDTGPISRFVGYRRAGRVAFSALRQSWGDPDIVHVQALFPAAMIARDIKRRLGVPYVITEHSEEYLASSKRRLVRTPGMLPLVLRPLALGASRTIAVSELLSSRLRQLRLAVNPVVVPNVVPLAPATAAATQLPHVIAHVSIMGPAKNLDMLLRAIDLLRESRMDFVLRLAGDGECRQSLELLSDKLGL